MCCEYREDITSCTTVNFVHSIRDECPLFHFLSQKKRNDNTYFTDGINIYCRENLSTNLEHLSLRMDCHCRTAKWTLNIATQRCQHRTANPTRSVIRWLCNLHSERPRSILKHLCVRLGCWQNYLREHKTKIWIFSYTEAYFMHQRENVCVRNIFV